MSNHHAAGLSARKRIVLLLIVGTFVCAALLQVLPVNASGLLAFVSPQQPAPRTKSDREQLAKKPRPSGTLKDRLGQDDGYGAVLFISADIGGNLEVCGCAIHPLGGVARRMGYINALRKRSPDAAVLMADAGHIFSDDLNEEKTALREDAVLMNDWIVKANEAIGLGIVNLSYRDLRYAGQLLSDGKQTAQSPLISANIKAAPGSSRLSPAPYVIRTITGKRLPKPVRIAFIGVTQPPPDEQKAAIEAAGFVVEDPAEAVKRTLAEVKDKVDVTAVIGYFKPPFANRLAMQNADLDLIIGADGSGLVPDPKQVSNALIMMASNQTKYLGELRFYTDKDGVVDRFTTRYIELDEVIPDDPAMAKMTGQARAEIDVVQRRVAEQIAEAHRARGDQPSIWATSEACAECHKAEYAIWQKSRHSHAFAALATKNREFDDSCVGCHSVGFRNQGFINIKATPQFANVQCESCHGPGAEHVKAPKAGNYKTPAAPGSCLVCHDPENSPDFVFAKYWPLVQHTNSMKTVSPEKTRARRRR
ncbi:MAG TPA: multiheme c-type cytochrome [Blastocatellia bacterium]|nr:multiheme c-type cytochrome [Blastocatellia bacterium]